MELSFSVDMQKASVRNVALFLGGLSLVRDGLEVMAHGQADERLSTARRNSVVVILDDGRLEIPYDRLLTLLQQAGQSLVLGYGWRHEVSEPAMSLVSDLLLRSLPMQDDMRLEVLRRGSLEGVLSDIFRRIFNRFAKVIRASNSLLPGHEEFDMETSLREIHGESEANPETKDLGIGIILVGVEMLRKAYQEERVTYIEVTA